MSTNIIAAVLALLAACTACAEKSSTEAQTDAPTPTPISSEWDRAGIESYSLTYTSQCGENATITFDPVTVEVVDGAIASHDGPEPPFRPLTVDDVVEIIAGASSADLVEVEYGQFGQPTMVSIDYTTGAIDDEFCLFVTEFTVADS